MFSNSICWNATNIGERYLKTSRDENNFIDNLEIQEILKSHNLRKIWSKILELNKSYKDELDLFELKLLSSYYFDSRHPSDDSFDVTDKDIKFCEIILDKIRNIVMN